MFNSDHKLVTDASRKWNEDCLKTIRVLFNRIDATILRDMSTLLTKAVYDEIVKNPTSVNILGFWDAARMKATGQGVHSTFVDILKIMRLQLTPGKEEKYFSDYIQARRH